ncbi:ABC transporter permease [Thermosulfuriphilus ammonigenes]|uniref:ABC transporter permease n=1 Tax=Thermosulfuriphilus ammonigenes TaxID=1936021 RepID=A0A6G7PX46_9BACT|nr:ABC transporter permease [Thermosulfuriphilus ammonigenes]MBA2847702.1 peptide/nickel transport system permease protein [Thermosulfuriphilus ammonigenes]QIJ72091.1 ABC transporter permease [Thermosulfuriphilus ammonigenes]HFB83686.1 ABC transporter permease [Thermodesulfatator sp.]
MLGYLLKRILLLIPTFLGITILSFMVMHLAPGEPVGIQNEFNPKFTPEMRERLRAQYGLDKPLYVQYARWLKGLVTLDLGRSFADQRPVWEKIKERLWVTLLINLLSMALIVLVAIPIGIRSAVKEGGAFDRIMTVFVFFGYAMPSFWLALLLMLLLGIKLGLLPISGLHSLMGYHQLSWPEKVLDWAKHLILPIFVSAFGGLAGLSRYMRSSMIEALRQDYITTARAKGLPERKVIYKHALRNALLPLITILGLSIPGLVGGSVIFESIFAIPGVGQLMWTAVMMRDYPVLMGNLVIVSVLTLLGNLLADIGYALADPRIRKGVRS